MSPTTEANLHEMAHAIRRRALEVTIRKNGSYLGQACSSAEILAVLHGAVMNHERDRFVLSPAHYALALFATMVEIGELDPRELERYGDDGALLEMIPSYSSPGMLFTTGSLAQGLSQAIGLALGERVRGLRGGRTFVLVSDGELQEGQTWEALMSAAHFQLSEITVVIDLNDSQVDGSPSRILGIEPVLDKLVAFGLDAVEIDGHDLGQLHNALSRTPGSRPLAVACRTNISQGIPSLSRRPNLHFVRFRPGEAERARADLAEGIPAERSTAK